MHCEHVYFFPKLGKVFFKITSTNGKINYIDQLFWSQEAHSGFSALVVDSAKVKRSNGEEVGSNGSVLDGEIRWETLRWFALVLGFGR